MASSLTGTYEGIGQILRSAAMQREMERIAGKIRDRAELIAPYDPETQTHFKDSFSVEPRPREDRACAAVVSDDPAGFYIEFGTAKTPAHHTLLRATDAAAE